MYKYASSKSYHEDTAVDFINNHKKYGYSSKTELVREAISFLQRQLEQQELEKSAFIYQEIYENDLEAQELIEAASTEWLE